MIGKLPCALRRGVLLIDLVLVCNHHVVARHRVVVLETPQILAKHPTQVLSGIVCEEVVLHCSSEVDQALLVLPNSRRSLWICD